MEWNGMKDDIFEPPFILEPGQLGSSKIAKIIINMLDKSSINTIYIYIITIVPIELINIMLNG